MTYRQIWKQYNNEIPVDETGRTYEIHHKDGNHINNDITNLECLSIFEHYQRHYSQGDYGACVLIAKRMGLPHDYISQIQKGKRRPGIGGVKKGTIPWNKGFYGYKCNSDKKQNKQSNSKLTKIDVDKIRKEYGQIYLSDVGTIKGNGRKMSYIQSYAHKMAVIYKVTPTCIKKIILKETWPDGIQIKQ